MVRFRHHVLAPILLLSSLGAAPKLALTGLTAVDVPPQKAEYVTEQLSVELTRAGAQVVTPADVKALLGLERQKQLVGCSEQSCIAEIASALGADGLVTGQLAKVGERLRLTVKRLSARTAEVITVASIDATDDTELLAGLPKCAHELLGTVAPAASFIPYLVVGVGGALAVVGAVFLGTAATSHQLLLQRGAMTVDYDQAMTLARDGARDQLVGLSLVGVGGAAIAGGLLWAFVARSSSVTVTPSVSATSARLSVEVRW